MGLTAVARLGWTRGGRPGRSDGRRRRPWLGVVLAFGLLAASCGGIGLDDEPSTAADSPVADSADDAGHQPEDLFDPEEGDSVAPEDFGHAQSDDNSQSSGARDSREPEVEVVEPEVVGPEVEVVGPEVVVVGPEVVVVGPEVVVVGPEVVGPEVVEPEPAKEAAAEEASEAPSSAASQSMGAGGGGFAADARVVGPFRPPPVEGCSDCEPNTFEDYGVNPPVNPEEDPLSTFALDVDTASYVVARNFLESGRVPPPEAVRVEEFVNYFDGGYEPAIDEFAVSLDAAPQPFSDAAHVLLRVGVQAPREFSDVVTPDSVVLVMDRSGSMDNSAGYGVESIPRYRLVHRAVELLLSGLPDHARVGAVAYSTRAEAILEPTEVSNDRERIAELIRDEVVPTNSTNAEAGLVLGYRMALREAKAGRTVLVLLLSDGVANVGATRTDDILEEIGERGDIGLSTIGVGLGPFNDALMEQLANRADGIYHYIDTPDEARRIFVDNLASLLTLAARDAKIQVEFNPAAVRSYRLLGFENRAIEDDDFRDDTRDAGEVGAGQSSTAVYELELADQSEGGEGPVATVTLRYRRPESQVITEVVAGLAVADIAPSFGAAGARFRLAAVAAEFAEVLRDSPYAEGSDMTELLEEAKAVVENLPEDDDAAELVRLIETARGPRG